MNPLTRAKTHPAHRFAAPSTIQTGMPLKELMDGRLVKLIGESLANVVGKFDRRKFQRSAERGLKALELKERAAHIARAMAEQLPDDFDELSPVLVRSFGPELTATEGNGLGPFFYLPHSHLIAEYGAGYLESGMAANYELTKRFSAEFSIRPFLIRYRAKALQRLKRWANDPNPHVRRLVSEGTRPRLPWAMRLPEFQQNPRLSLPLLESLKGDPELYVRRSVANHLGDIAKDHLPVVCDLCEEWLQGVAGDADARADNRRWIIRHALRHPAKKQHRRALRIRAAASPKNNRRGWAN
jgi:3-methyladenine DNA glycosylase AlkC